MKNSLIGVLLLAILCCAFAAGAQQALPLRDQTYTDCEVLPDKQALLSAEEAGVLVKVAVDQGAAPQAGDLLVQIDDRQAQLQMAAAKHALDAATERFTSPIEIEYAEESSKVAYAEYQMMLTANKQATGAVAQIEVERARLQWNTTKLQIKKAEHDKRIAGFDMNGKSAEYELGKLAVDRRSIEAPFDGIVMQLYKHQSEWVNPGDPILDYMSLKTMRVEKRIPQKDFDPHEVAGRRVTVEVTLARGRPATFSGQIVYVSPQLDLDDTFLVRAEVENRQEMGHWVLRPNSQASMTIHFGPPPAGAGRPRMQ